MDQLYFIYDGRGFKCSVEPCTAWNSDPWWAVEVGGVTARVMLAQPHDSEGAVRRQVLQWYQDGRRPQTA